MFDCASTIARSSSGTPIMSQMTRSGIGAAMSATTSMVPSPSSAFRRAAASTSSTIRCTESTSCSSIRGRERLRHDPADLGVPRVVHADHRAVELVQVGRHVGDRHRALAGAEHRRLGADRLQVGVPGDGVVARARARGTGPRARRRRRTAAPGGAGRRPRAARPAGRPRSRGRRGPGRRSAGGRDRARDGVQVSGEPAASTDTQGPSRETVDGDCESRRRR